MEAIGHELSFWKGFVCDERFVNGWIPSDVKTPDLQVEIYNFFLSLPNYVQLKVLDIGSGAVSVLNGTFPKKNIVTVDPLGSLYPFIFDYSAHAITPPLPCGGEEIEFIDEFDIVHCSNAIDHSQDPYKVFINMVRACRDEGHVIIQGLVDEAIHENWEGFHQYNFTINSSGQVSYSDRSGKTVIFPGNQVLTLLKPLYHADRQWFISVWKANVLKQAFDI